MSIDDKTSAGSTETPDIVTLGMRWIPTSEVLPPIGKLVAYRLKGNPEVPKIGFRDSPRAYCDRHPGQDPFGWTMTTWWTDADDESDAWEDIVVIDWHPLAELPS